MTQRELTEKERSMRRENDNAATLITNEKERQEDMSTVQSILHETDQHQSEEEDTLGNLGGVKISGPKVSKYARYKKSKGKGGSVTDMQDSGTNEMTSISMIKEESRDSILTAYSKKSLLQPDKTMTSDSTRQINSTESLESSFRPSVVSNILLPSEELQSVTPPENQGVESESRLMDPSRTTLSTLTVHERGNYLSSMAPSPIDEYGNDNSEENPQR